MTNLFDASNHPILIARAITERYDADIKFAFSRYEVAPPGMQARATRSDVICIAGADLTAEWLCDRLAELGYNEELAWHSTVDRNGAQLHIPMIDFLGRAEGWKLADITHDVARQLGCPIDFQFFDVGRSFHAYGLTLLEQARWYQFLGELLTLQRSRAASPVDSRWIGHSLVRGFSALRWSHNTSRYEGMPRLVASEVPPRAMTFRAR